MRADKFVVIVRTLAVARWAGLNKNIGQFRPGYLEIKGHLILLLILKKLFIPEKWFLHLKFILYLNEPDI